MSNYDPIDIDTGKPMEHHHHSHGHSWQKHSGKLWFGFVCCVLVVGFVLLLLWGFAYTDCNQVNHHMHDLKLQMQAQNKQFSSQGLYSIARALSSKTEYNLCLSHMALYHTVDMGGGGNTSIILLEKTDTSKFSSNQGTKNYVMRAQFNIRYNVEPSKLGYDVEKLGIRNDERYMVVHYEVASTYTQFSSIKFVESTMDSYKKMIVPRRIITLCSNDVTGSVRRCGRHATLEDMLIMNNTRIIPMDQPNVRIPSHKNKTSVNPKDTAPANDDDDEEYEGEVDGDIDHDEVSDSRNFLIDEISHLRLFNLLLYKDSGDDEYISLSIEPTRCGSI